MAQLFLDIGETRDFCNDLLREFSAITEDQFRFLSMGVNIAGIIANELNDILQLDAPDDAFVATRAERPVMPRTILQAFDNRIQLDEFAF